ncbi:hypothetical protein L6452_10373 [Arctium lappa]|uniref:Uncharacterized protein n=1 Tax=Arctium lappa TaxID=4217 RepID=A0ACB9DN70_ARCLA|nr:hypothetical protein L6452_10373 [Arctium lappa]
MDVKAKGIEGMLTSPFASHPLGTVVVVLATHTIHHLFDPKDSFFASFLYHNCYAPSNSFFASFLNLFIFLWSAFASTILLYPAFLAFFVFLGFFILNSWLLLYFLGDCVNF